ncbi:hypothetical protein P22_2881 [Propionispora sp. 2/2-37]|uniref:MarR family transcriptional regulator n=1 Tax=Propionispora sp. 2/2-37 TaxID=1677858 RepID=UPI0006BB6CCF|nr:MarR family transcriptional regulator [Propionispora sp. 2/2-37]CUH96770.1 hypothetical protein P22_2881 [Propionispora sp. 2/2-37]
MDTIEKLVAQYIRVCEKQEALSKILGQGVLQDYWFSEVHCIDLIGRTEDANVTKLASKLNMTRGAISKATKKMLANGDITSYQNIDNKKEIYFKLTEKGKQIFLFHEKKHKEQEIKLASFFRQLSSEEKNVMLAVMEKLFLFLDVQMKEKDHSTK